MPKNTRLGEDAAIYQKKEKKTEKEKLKDMNFKMRLSYLWDYYRYQALIIIALVILIPYSIYSFTKPKVAIVLNTAIVNNTIVTDVWSEYKEKLTEYLDLNPQLQEVKLNDGFYFNGSLEYSANMRQALGVYVASSEIDIIIAPESEFFSFVELGFFAPLSDQLPTDLYSSLTDKFYLSATESNPKVMAYGIYVDDTKLYREYSIPTSDDPVLIGIVTNSKHKEYAKDFIRFLFNEK